MKKKSLTLALLVGLSSCALHAAEQPRVTPPEPAPRPPAAEEEKPAGSKAEQYAAAQKKLGILKLRLDEKHPAVLKQRAQLARLQKEMRDEEKEKGPRSPAEELALAKQELEELLKKYTEEHPRVKSLRQKIAQLEQKR